MRDNADQNNAEYRHFSFSEHQQSEHVVSVHSKKINQRKEVVGHILDTLAKIVHGRMVEWNVHQVRAKMMALREHWCLIVELIFFVWGKGS